jgi:hypothetical protein
VEDRSYLGHIGHNKGSLLPVYRCAKAWEEGRPCACDTPHHWSFTARVPSVRSVWRLCHMPELTAQVITRMGGEVVQDYETMALLAKKG